MLPKIFQRSLRLLGPRIFSKLFKPLVYDVFIGGNQEKVVYFFQNLLRVDSFLTLQLYFVDWIQGNTTFHDKTSVKGINSLLIANAWGRTWTKVQKGRKVLRVHTREELSKDTAVHWLCVPTGGSWRGESDCNKTDRLYSHFNSCK